MMVSSLIPVRAARLPWRVIDGRAVIVQPGAGKVHELNPVATFLWELADGGLQLGEIARKILDRFEIHGDSASQQAERIAEMMKEVQEDAIEFYLGLEDLGLLEWKDPCPY